MAVMQGGGITIDLPDGWDAEIYRRFANTSALAADGTGEQTNAVLHAANFALPAERGDFGSGGVEIMRAGDILIVLFEYNRRDVGQALFETVGLPLPLAAEDFDPNSMQRPLTGLVGVQRFFQASGRAWCLYVVVADTDREALVASANELLASIDIEDV